MGGESVSSKAHGWEGVEGGRRRNDEGNGRDKDKIKIKIKNTYPADDVQARAGGRRGTSQAGRWKEATRTRWASEAGDASRGGEAGSQWGSR